MEERQVADGVGVERVSGSVVQVWVYPYAEETKGFLLVRRDRGARELVC
jgi:hypothetical protein